MSVIFDKLNKQELLVRRQIYIIGKISFYYDKWQFTPNNFPSFTAEELNIISEKIAKLESNYPNGITLE